MGVLGHGAEEAAVDHCSHSWGERRRVEDGPCGRGFERRREGWVDGMTARSDSGEGECGGFEEVNMAGENGFPRRLLSGHGGGRAEGEQMYVVRDGG